MENKKESISLLKENGGEVLFTDVDFSNKDEFLYLMDEDENAYRKVIDDCPFVLITDFSTNKLMNAYVLSVILVGENRIMFSAFTNDDNYGMDVAVCYISDCLFCTENFIYEEIGKRLGCK